MATKKVESPQVHQLKEELVAAHNQQERLKAELEAAKAEREKALRMVSLEREKLAGAIELMAARDLSINGVGFAGDATVAVLLMDERIPVPDLAHAIARGLVLRRGASQATD